MSPPNLLSLSLGLLGLVVVAGCVDSASNASDDPVNSGPRKVLALGWLEPAEGLIAISAAPGDRLKLLDPDLEINQRIPQNGILGLMSSYDTRLAQLAALATKREMAAEQHELDKMLADVQIKNAHASLAQAKAKLKEARLQEKRLSYLGDAADNADSSYQRLVELSATDEELVTELQLSRQKNRADQARKDFEIASENYPTVLAAAESAHAAAIANKQAAEKSRLRLETLSPIRAIDAEISLARHALAQSVLLTPDKNPKAIDPMQVECVEDDDADGPYTLLKVFLNQGEAVTQTPVLQLGDLSKIVCIAEVYQADAKNIRPGQKAVISSEAFSAPFDNGIEGQVVRVARVVAKAGMKARNPLAPVDRSVVAVRIAIDPKNTEAIAEASQWMGLQVKVSFAALSSDSL